MADDLRDVSPSAARFSVPDNSTDRFVFIVVAAAILPYLASLGFDFVRYDDYPFILENPNIRRLEWAVESFWNGNVIARYGWDPIWRPLRTWIWALLFSFVGPSAWAFHLLSVVMHAIASVCAYGLSRRLTRERTTALIASLIFALHPVQSEVAGWISALSDSLFTALIFVSLSHLVSGRKSVGFLAFALALLAKESAVMFPLLYVITVCLGQHERFDGRRIRNLAFIMAILAVYLGARIFATAGMPSTRAGEVANIPKVFIAFLNYFRLTVWPVGLHLNYFFISLDTVGHLEILAATAIWLAIFFGALALRRSGLITFSIFWMISLLPWAPMMITPDSALVQERFLYPALFGPAVFAATAVGRLQKKPIGLLCLLFGIMAGWSYQESLRWKDSGSLWNRQLEKEPGSWSANIVLGKMALDRGDSTVAIARFEKAAVLRPQIADMWLELSLAYLRLGRLDDADSSARRALGLNNSANLAWFRIARVRAAMGDTAGALAAIDTWSTAAGHHDGRPAHLRADLLRDWGFVPESLYSMLDASAREPRVAEFRRNAAIIALETGDRARARSLAEEALDLDPWDKNTVGFLAFLRSKGIQSRP